MTRQEALNYIMNSGGRIVSLDFTKRSTGELRHMVCRLGVTKHLKGGELSYDPAKHNLLLVFDMSKQAYRAVPLDGIVQIKVGNRYEPVSD